MKRVFLVGVTFSALAAACTTAQTQQAATDAAVIGSDIQAVSPFFTFLSLECASCVATAKAPASSPTVGSAPAK